jgi:hypothetical protein
MTHTLYFFLFMMALYAGALLMHICRRHTGGQFLLATGILLNLIFLIDHAVITGVFVWNALVDPVFFLPFVIALLILILPDSRNMPRPAVGSALLLLIAATLFAAFYPKGIIPPAANKSGISPFLFFVFENCAYALFGLSGVLAAVLSDNRALARTVRRLLVLGFISFSIAQVVGGIWSFLGWGHPFMWGSRHLSSAVVWLIYAALIHMRFASSFIIPERWFTTAGGLLSLYIVYSHLIFEMGIRRVGG